MDDDKIYIGYEVSIKNDDVEKIYVRITAPAGKDALEALTPIVTGATLVEGTTGDYEVAVGGTLVVTFTFQLDPDTALVGTGQNLGINSAFKLASTASGLAA
ncbi:MAG: hypothetical protein ACOX6H_02730 [Christensenellales bacterium]|jgi:hypothetical protein